MSTFDRKVSIYLKKFLPQQQVTSNFLEYLLKASRDNFSRIYPTQGIFTGGTLSADTPNTFDIETPCIATNGLGHLLQLDPAEANNIPFENTTGQIYRVGLRYNEIPRQTEVNVRTGAIEYTFVEERIGELAEPNAIVDNGTTLTITVDNVTEAAVSNAGRTVRVWLKKALSQADAFFEGVVYFSGGANKIDTTNLLGQIAGSVSVNPSDYQVFLVGPTVKKNTNISLDPNVAYLGHVVGAGAGNTPSTFVNTEIHLYDLSDLPDIADSVKMFLTGGGLVTWDLTSQTLGWTAAMKLYLPNRPFNFTINAGSVTGFANGEVIYIERDDVGGIKSFTKVPMGSVPDDPKFEPIAIRDGSNIYFRNGALELKGDTTTTSGRINDITQDLLTFIGAANESDSDPLYTSTTFVIQSSNLVAAISALDAQLTAMANDLPEEEHFVVIGAPQTNFIATSLTWNVNPNVVDIEVYVNGRRQRPDRVGTNLYDYKKVSTTEIQFSYAVPVDATVTIRDERTGGGGGGGGGIVWATPVNANIIPDTDCTYDLGSGAFKFKDAYFCGKLYVGGGIDPAYIQLVPQSSFGSIPNNSLLVDQTDSFKVKLKNNAGILIPLNEVTSSDFMIKQMVSSHGSIIPAGRPVSKQVDGSIIPADSDAATGKAYVGITMAAIPISGTGPVMMIGPNVADAVLGLGFAPGDEIFLSETGSYTNDPNSFTGQDDTIIRVGIADTAAGVVSPTATDLIMAKEIMADFTPGA